MSLNDIVKSMFDGLKAAKANPDPFEQLEKSWYLYEVRDLRKLEREAKTKEQDEMILDHLYKWDATRVDYYKKIENKIIQRHWGDDD
jgi:hypothetical protein